VLVTAEGYEILTVSAATPAPPAFIGASQSATPLQVEIASGT
jgi:hypothetical protein